MPTIAIVDGINIQFYFDEHPPPHFHATFAKFVAQIQIDPAQVMRGSLPPMKLAAVLAWASSNHDALMTVWDAVARGEKPKRLK